MPIWNSSRQNFSYDAITDKSRRKSPVNASKHESTILQQSDRRKLIATTQDQRRNLSLVAWAFRMHLSFTTQFTLHVTTEDDGLNEAIEDAFDWYNRADNCDISGRHSLKRMMRLAEGHRFLDGDMGVIFSDTGKLQLVEGDRIAKPTSGFIPDEYKNIDWNQGAELNKYGGAEQYIICNRQDGGSTLAFDSVVSARAMRLYANLERIDQHRGVSPLAAAVNSFQDVYEAGELNMMKAKAHALFGVIIARESSGRGELGIEQTADLTADADDDTLYGEERYAVKPEGTFKMELAPGESASTVESKTPSAEFLEFTKFFVQVSLLAFDLPMSFFDSRESSYAGQRMDLILYEFGNTQKRCQMQDMLSTITNWKLARWTSNNRDIRDDSEEPQIKLPGKMRRQDISYEWIPMGIPWIDPAKEMGADRDAISSALQSRSYTAKKRGLPRLKRTMKELEKEEEEIRRRGITVIAGDPGSETINNIESDETENDVQTKAG